MNSPEEEAGGSQEPSAGADVPARPQPIAPHQPGCEPILKWSIRAAVAVLLLQLLLTPLAIFFAPIIFPDQIVDDAYMFLRYADRLVEDGRLCWNPGDAPTYGLTSLVYGLWVCGVRGLLGGDPSRIMTWSSLAPALALPSILALTLLRGLDLGKARWTAVLCTLLIARAPVFNSFILIHGFTGMDTTFSACCVTACLWMWHGLASAPSMRRAAATGSCCAAIYLVRPDALVFPFCALAGLAFLHQRPAVRDGARWAFVSMVVVLIVLAAGCALYFGTPVPLSFYAKNTAVYGQRFVAAYEGVAWSETREFVRNYAPLVIPAGLYGISLLSPRRARARALDAGVVVGLAAFLVYQTFFLLPVMYYYQRFHVPALPAVVWLAAKGVHELISRAGAGCSAPAARRATRFGTALCWVIIAWCALPMAASPVLEPTNRTAIPSLWESARFITAGVRRGDVAEFSIVENYHARFGAYWHRLDEYSRLPDDLCIAATEVGYPAAMNPHKRIIDLAGLNNTELMLRGFDVSAMLERERPDLVYMPYPDYEDLIKALRSSPRFETEYEEFQAAALGNRAFGVALRRDSPYYDELRRITVGSRAGSR